MTLTNNCSEKAISSVKSFKCNNILCWIRRIIHTSNPTQPHCNICDRQCLPTHPSTYTTDTECMWYINFKIYSRLTLGHNIGNVRFCLQSVYSTNYNKLIPSKLFKIMFWNWRSLKNNNDFFLIWDSFIQFGTKNGEKSLVTERYCNLMPFVSNINVHNIVFVKHC